MTTTGGNTVITAPHYRGIVKLGASVLGISDDHCELDSAASATPFHGASVGTVR